jgi:uncharacterized protein with FMN-binding domain
MKKLYLSTSLIILFVAYVAYIRIAGFSSSNSVADPSVASVPSGTTTSAQNTNVAAPATGSQPRTDTRTVTPQPKVVPTAPQPAVPTTTTKPQGQYKDGSYTGDSVDAYYGNVQVKAIIQNGKIANVQFLDYPQDRSRSQYISSQAIPLLTQEAIQAQNANVDIISGATAMISTLAFWA